MTQPLPLLDGTLATLDAAAKLRAAFDRSFAEPLPVASPQVDAIAVHAGGGPCAFGQGELAALRTDLHITPLASQSAALIGVASFRGALVPVWDLGLLLHGAPVTQVRWCAVLRDETVAVAFDRLDGRVRAPAPLASVLELDGTIYPVFELAATVAGAKSKKLKGDRHAR